MEAFWAALEGSGLGVLARNSVYLYPAANILHVLGVMGFFAAVAAMDLSLAGVLRGTPPREVIRRLRPFALLCFVLVAATGLVLLAPEATAIGANPAFLLKGLAILLALANLGANEWAVRRSAESAAAATAIASLALWLCVAALGRAIAYV